MGMTEILEPGAPPPLRLLTSVYVQTTFVGFHRWKDAPAPVEFLRNWHRHVFHVTLTVEVGHDNRDVEFFVLKHELNAYLKTHWDDKHFEASCEQIAKAVVTEFVRRKYDVILAKVSEDGENGAMVQNYTKHS